MIRVGADFSREIGAWMVLGGTRYNAHRPNVVASRQGERFLHLGPGIDRIAAKQGATWLPALMAAMRKALARPLNDSARAIEMIWPP